MVDINSIIEGTVKFRDGKKVQNGSKLNMLFHPNVCVCGFVFYFFCSYECVVYVCDCEFDDFVGLGFFLRERLFLSRVVPM